MLTLIAAVSDNNVIGKNNDLIWHLPNDFKRFKKLTTGHQIIMGRKTFESLPGLLPNRTHIVISRKRDLTINKCKVVTSLKNAIRLAYASDTNPYIIGGGEIYKQAITIADKLEITRVHTSVEGDTFFPEIDPTIWQLITEKNIKKDDSHKYDYSYLTYERKVKN